jgi:hypothetical protein
MKAGNLAPRDIDRSGFPVTETAIDKAHFCSPLRDRGSLWP